MLKPTKLGTYERFKLETVSFGPEQFKLDWFMSALDKVWDDNKIAMDWLGLEAFQVDLLKSELTHSQKVRLLAESIDAFTKRGHFGAMYDV